MMITESNSQIEFNFNNLYSNNIQPVNIYVKFAYGITSNTYSLPNNLSISDMVYKLNEKIFNDFNITAAEYELVEAGQETPYGVPTEEGQAFIINTNQTIYTRFNGNKFIAFYIRLLPGAIHQMATEQPQQQQQEQPQQQQQQQEQNQCMVCQEEQSPNLLLATYFGCCHFICDSCCLGCIQHNITRCAVCRCQRL